MNFLAAGALLALAGLAGWWLASGRQRYRARRRETLEDTLKFLAGHDAEGATVEALAGYLHLGDRTTRNLLDRLHRQGLVRLQGNRILLTPEGRRQATRILRAHRLWEFYLSYTTDLPLQDLHRLAEKQEHRLTPEQLRDLAARVGHPLRDPHGDPIPDEAGTLPLVAPGKPLTDVPAQTWVQVVHVEDEPADIFAQIVAEGIDPGTVFLVLENLPTGIHLRLDGRDLWLAPIVANNISVQVLPEAPPRPLPRKTLADIEPGTWVRVARISPRIQGLLRRRLLDLGFTRGARVKPVLRSAFGHGDPTAYWVRGSLIALRREQAREILVQEDSHETAPPA